MNYPYLNPATPEFLHGIATAKVVKTAQRFKSPLVLQSPPTRTQI